MGKVLAERNVRWYALSYTLSLLGNGALWFAAAVWVKELTGSNSAAGLVFFAYTAASYSVSAWAKLTSTAATSVVISTKGTNTTAFTPQYDTTKAGWTFTTTNGDTTSTTQYKTSGTAAATLNTWTHLVVTYNATTHLMSLYVNGTLIGTATNTTPWDATGTLNIGSAGTASFFPGELSDVQAWNYALNPTQITALYDQIQ
jgi:Concanavalin A-like lectin/glucanases superfamily